MKLHVCLLYPGGPTEEKTINSFLSEQLQDPLVQDSLPSFLRAVWIWVLLFFRKRTPLLEGPCYSFQHAQEHVQELNRLLGPDFSCYAIHHFGKANVDSIIKTIPNKSNVALVPLIPHRCQTLYSAQGSLRSQLQKKQCSITEFGHYATKKPFVQALCTQIRKEIISSKTEQYGLVFIEQRQPERWNKSSTEYKKDIQKTVSAVMKSIHTKQPHIVLHTNAASWKKEILAWKHQSISTIITVPTSWVVPAELLRVEQQEIEKIVTEQGLTCRHAAPIQSQPFDQFLVETIRNIFERIQK